MEKEFRNKLLSNLCEKKLIKQRHRSVRHPQSQGAVEKLNDFIGKSLKIAFADYLKNGSKERFDIENALKSWINNQKNKIHSKTGYRLNKLIMIEDKNVMEEMNKKIQDNENRIKVKTIEKIKPGTKVFLVGELKLDKEANKIIKGTTTTIKSKIKKSKKYNKVLAKITDVSKIKVNQVTVKVF